MSQASRTINPLHFEDLEPHRFEDLVRQLAYGFRPWRYLDATGRLGRDGGLDIRGTEAGVLEQGSDAEMSDEEAPEDSSVDTDQSTGEDREWRIQCKRYKEIGPQLMRQIVAETVPEPDHPPYGLIVAAACDVSAETLSNMRQEAFGRGVTEAYAWTRVHLEDLLFQPDNDRLLFAYFGISLNLRRKSRLQELRHMLAVKRKIMRALKLDSAAMGLREDILIRDVEDTKYPFKEDVPGFRQMTYPPWHIARAEFMVPAGLMVCRFDYQGWVKEDGTWDSAVPMTVAQGSNWDYWSSEERADREERERQRAKIREQVPVSERRLIEVAHLLPWEHILEIDPAGDGIHNGVHLFCRFDGDNGPYVGSRGFALWEHGLGIDRELDVDARTALFTKPNDAAPRRPRKSRRSTQRKRPASARE